MEFGAVCILTNDAPRLACFYAEILRKEPFIEGSHYGFGESRLAVYDPGGVVVPENKNMSLIFFTADLDAEYERIKNINGATITSPPQRRPWGAYSFWLTDPDGNTVSVAENKKGESE